MINMNQDGEIVDVERVGMDFIQAYYTMLNKDPNRLSEFYSKNSSMKRSSGNDSSSNIDGQLSIHKKIKDLRFSNCKVCINSIDILPSISQGVILQIIGEMSNNSKPSKDFAQSFFLARQEGGFYIQNDIFRFLQEDDSDIDPIQDEPEEKVDITSKFSQSKVSDETPKETHSYQETTHSKPVHKDNSKPEKRLDKEPSRPRVKEQEGRPQEKENGKVEHASWASLAGESQNTWESSNNNPKHINQHNHKPRQPISREPHNATPDPRKQMQHAKSDASIFISGDVIKVPENELREHFSKFGKILNLNVIKQKEIAFIDYFDPEAVTRVLETPDIEIGGNKITVARKRPPFNNRDGPRRGGYSNYKPGGPSRGGYRNVSGNNNPRPNGDS